MDFGSFVASARAAREGLSPYGVYPLTLHVVLPGFESWNPNLNPPISAVLFQVFDWADPTVSLRIWWWISLACYVITAVLVLRRFGRSNQKAKLCAIGDPPGVPGHHLYDLVPASIVPLVYEAPATMHRPCKPGRGVRARARAWVRGKTFRAQGESDHVLAPDLDFVS